MKEMDTTPIEAESDESEFKWIEFQMERMIGDVWKELRAMQNNQAWFLRRIKHLEKQVANLEAQKPPQDLSSDPEWFA